MRLIWLDLGRTIGGGQVESRDICSAWPESDSISLLVHPNNFEYFGLKKRDALKNFVKFFYADKIYATTRLSLLVAILFSPFSKKIYVVQSFPKGNLFFYKLISLSRIKFTFNSCLTKNRWKLFLPASQIDDSPVIYSPISDKETLSKIGEKRRKNEYKRREEFVIGFISRPMPRKNFKLFVEAVSKVDRNITVLVWGGSKIEFMKQVPDEYHSTIEKYFRFMPRQSPERIYSEIDLLCLPSTDEPFGRVYVEAALCGVPSIASEVCGAAELIPDWIHQVPLTVEALSREIGEFSHKHIPGKTYNGDDLISPDEVAYILDGIN